MVASQQLAHLRKCSHPRAANSYPTPFAFSINHPPRARHPSDLGQRDSRHLRRNALPLGHGEQQFVILAAVQSQVEVNFAGRLPHPRPRNQLSCNLGADAALFAEVSQVGAA